MDRELIIVDDCSTDGTAVILDRMASEQPSLRLIRKAVNEGKGAAIRTAIEYASGDFCLVQDADLEYDPSDIPIRSNRFGFEREITMKAAKRKLRIYEVPISYHGRTYEEGKKVGWKDGVKAGTPQYLSWLARVLRPHLGGTVLELGAGIGNIAGRLRGRRLQYVAAEKDPLYLHALRNCLEICGRSGDGDRIGGQNLETGEVPSSFWRRRARRFSAAWIERWDIGVASARWS